MIYVSKNIFSYRTNNNPINTPHQQHNSPLSSRHKDTLLEQQQSFRFCPKQRLISTRMALFQTSRRTTKLTSTAYNRIFPDHRCTPNYTAVFRALHPYVNRTNGKTREKNRVIAIVHPSTRSMGRINSIIVSATVECLLLARHGENLAEVKCAPATFARRRRRLYAQNIRAMQ